MDERYCRKCNQLYQQGPHPEEEAQFIQGNSGALVYPAGSWKHRDVVVKFGRWKTHGRDFYLSQYFSADELADLIQVAAQARQYVSKGEKRSRR